MKRTFVSMVAAMALAGLLSFAQAAEKKQVALEGELQCAKCSLKADKECSTVLSVKEGDQTVQYFLAKNKVSKPYDAKTCGGEKIKATVEGTVAEKDGKKVLTAQKITES